MISLRRGPGWVLLVCWGLLLTSPGTSWSAESAPRRPRDEPASAKKPARPAANARRWEDIPPAVAVPAASKPKPEVEEEEDDEKEAKDPNVRNMEANFHEQFQQLLYSELAFLRRVCNMPTPEFAGIAKIAQRRMGGALREYATAITKPRRVGGDGPAVPDASFLIQRRLVAIVEAKLGPEPGQRYREECERRAAKQRRAVVLNLVAALDSRFLFTAEQREKLVQTLSAKYQEDWNQWCQVFVHNPQLLPAIPDDAIVPVLNEKQAAVWKQSPKQGGHFFGGMMFGQGGLFGDLSESQEIARIIAEASDE